ncbi:DUF4326 domain-containing protein [Micromonospora sp. NPDC005299]|uniref:DUF4326 domain-containing protein n=1 Tax=Micromonospora sp. NPDC005299 TaxID=3364231 RepID=UPI00368AD409
MPKRIQRQRTKGWRMPENTVYVGRPTKWGNPWKVGERSPWAPYGPMDPAAVVETFRYGIDNPLGRHLIRQELAGQDLACWCPLDQPCHADVLLEIANGGDQR